MTDKERLAIWRQNHKAEIKEAGRLRYQNNKELIKAQSRAWYQSHKAQVKARKKAYKQTRRNSDLDFRIRDNLRTRLYVAIKSGQKAGSAVRDLGCTIPELRSHLESKFQPGMTWENWTRDGWHIDHIMPLASFNLTDRAQFLQACHFTNLQPLWAEKNFSKGARV